MLRLCLGWDSMGRGGRGLTTGEMSVLMNIYEQRLQRPCYVRVLMDRTSLRTYAKVMNLRVYWIMCLWSQCQINTSIIYVLKCIVIWRLPVQQWNLSLGDQKWFSLLPVAKPTFLCWLLCYDRELWFKVFEVSLDCNPLFFMMMLYLECLLFCVCLNQGERCVENEEIIPETTLSFTILIHLWMKYCILVAWNGFPSWILILVS